MVVPWLAYDDREAVTLAAAALEVKLTVEPLSIGESRESSVSRLAFEPPLGFTFDVIADDAMVRITAIWLLS